MHLAVLACYGAVALYHYSRVVVEAGGAPLEERGYDDHAVLAGHLAEELGARAGYGLGKVERFNIFRLAEVERVVQLLQHHKGCTLAAEPCCLLGKSAAVVCYVAGVVLLYDAYFHFCYGCRVIMSLQVVPYTRQIAE